MFVNPDAALTPREVALLAEDVDTRNWMDQHAAAPPALREALGLASSWEGGLAMVRSRIPFSHFNMVLTLGCPAPAHEAAFAAIERFFAAGSAGRHWILINDHSEPRSLAQQLLARGYEAGEAWERVVLRGARPDLWAAHAQGCELVGATNQADWSGFICRCYGMPPPIETWLHALVGRRGWLHALRREGGRSEGAVVMARSLFTADNGWAWLGIDAPVPGVMAPCFDDDQKVIATLLLAAAQAGAHTFVSDIEAPAADRSGPGYRCWGELGFEAPYLRRLFSKPSPVPVA
jgi:hypothetical protein